MINLNTIVQSAHDGEGFNSLAQQFDISEQQAQEAVQALLPAISMGLQQQMQGAGFAQVLGHLATAQNRAAFDDAEAAQSEETVTAGTDALNHLFGNENVSAQVADHAAEHSSLTSDLLQSMLPVIAAMVMGGLFKAIAAKGGLGGIFGQAAAPAPTAPSGGGGLGDILGQMTGQRAPSPAPQQGGGLGDILGQMTGRAQPQATPQNSGGGLGDMLDRITRQQAGQPAQQQGGGGLGDLLGGLLGGGQHPQAGQPAGGGGGLADILGQLAGGGQRGQAAPQQGGGGLGDLLGGLLGGALGGGAATGGARGNGQPGGINPATIQAGLEQLTNMFGHGAKVSPQQQSGLEGILGQILGGGRR